MTPTSEIESALVDSVECATDYQSPEVAPIWAAITLATEGLKERDAEIERLNVRQGELLETVRRVSQTTPFPEEFAGWEGQRAKLVAEVGTLKARVAELEAVIEESRSAADDRRFE